MTSASLTRPREEFLESLSELYVEDGVDERIEETVDVSEPDEQRKGHWVDVAYRGRAEEVVANTDGVHDVDCEERNPTEEKHTYKKKQRDKHLRKDAMQNCACK